MPLGHPLIFALYIYIYVCTNNIDKLLQSCELRFVWFNCRREINPYATLPQVLIENGLRLAITSCNYPISFTNLFTFLNF